MTTTLTLHRYPLSGHSHRVQLALSLMGLPVELVDVDLKRGAHKSPEVAPSRAMAGRAMRTHFHTTNRTNNRHSSS